MIKSRIVILAGLFFALAADAQTVTNVIDSFSTNSYLNGSITNTWKNWFGGAFQSLAFDPASDANANPASGSLKIVCNYPANDQFTVFNGFGGISPALSGIIYTNLQCDVRFAAGSATSGGNYGNLQFGMSTPSYGQDYWNNGFTVPVGNTNWVHVSIPLSSTDTNIQQYGIGNVFIHIWSGSSLIGPSTLWVDNIQFVGTATNTGTVTINYTNTQQRIDGFGASSAWMSGSLATADADLLFSTNTGAGLSLLRTRIAPDVTTWEGNIAQQAQARGARIWSTPWSPPVAYKDTNSVNGGNFVSSTNNYKNYAAQLANYVVNLKNAYGISLYALSIQNEPDAIVTYESCWWTSQQFHDFIPYLSAALVSSNVASTQIMLPEDEHWQWNLATNTMNDVTTSNLVGILGGHNYGSSASPVTQFGNPCPKTLWETEHYINTIDNDSITNGLLLAQEIHSFLTVAQANAYNYWWLTGSGTGSIANSTANPAKRLFVMGNYSRFVRPNYYRVAATNNSTALVSAYKDSASSNFVIVAANPTAIAVNQKFVLTNFPATGTLTQWVTSASLSLSNQGPVSVTGNTFNYTLPPWAVVSFVYIQPLQPGIVQQPTNQTGVVGGAITFTVGATGTAPLFYQWLFNGTNSLAGATNASLSLTGLALTNGGNYSVIVTNYLGSVTSALAALAVNTGQSIFLTNSDPFNYSSFDATSDSGGLTQANWSDGNWPTNANNYFTGIYMLRTPSGVGNVTFPGNSLTVNGGGGFINLKGNGGAVMTVASLILSGGAIGNGNGGQTYGVAGALNVISNSAFALANDATRTISVSSTITGAAALTNGYTGNGLGTIIYTGNNTGFTGPMITGFGVILKAGSQANLGGNPASFNAAQFVLDNGVFQPTASFALNNPNSGITITTNGGTFNLAPGIALAVSNPITGAGTLASIGGGTLILNASNTATGNLIVSNSALAVVGNASFKNFLLGISNNATLDVTALNVPLAVSNKIALAGNLILNVNSTGTSSTLAASNLVYGGTLTLNNLGPAFAVSNSFQLFTATNYAGGFSYISPATPGFNLLWDISKLTVNGTLAVISGGPPFITQQPVSQTVTPGNPASFSVTAGSSSPLSYQWKTNGVNLVGATATNYSIASAGAASAGNYTVVITNSYGSVTSIIATLTVTTNTVNTLVVSASQPGFAISSNLFGAFLEDLNYAGESGVYGELIKNRSFVNATTGWSQVTQGTAAGSMALDTANMLNTNNAQSLKLTFSSGSGSVGAGNNGFWGIPLSAGANYNLNFYAAGAAGFSGAINVRLESNNGGTLYAQTNFSGVTTSWQKFSATLTPSVTDTNARLVVSIAQAGSVWIDVVSLFPEQTFASRPNGMRSDLAGAINAMQPAFLRFPGGNFIEGNTLTNAFRWKTTIGDVASRPGHWNGAWGYYSTDGLGYHEYLQFCEDVGATPVFAINCGMALNYSTASNSLVPLALMSPWVQDALDAIQYANGATNTTWGALRAANGHPAPFNLQYLEIGNENGGTNYADRYALFYDAITNAYPTMNIIADWWYDTPTGTPTNRPVQFSDQHYYYSPSWFIQNATLFNNSSRSGPKVFVGEYAAQSVTYGSSSNRKDLSCALAEAAWMTGLERNADIVVMACYAPLLANVNYENWNPDAIYFNNNQWFGTPSYQVQKMFAQNRGDVLLPSQFSYLPTSVQTSGAVGVGTWNTQSSFSNLVVTASNGVALYQSDFVAQGTNGWIFGTGSWITNNGSLQQTNGGTGNYAWTGSTNWSNYTLTLNAQKLSGSEGFQIVFNYQDANNYSFFNIGGWNNTSNAVQTVIGGSMTTPGSVPGSVTAGQWYNIQITVNGSEAKCYLNGTLILDVTNLGLPPVLASTTYSQRTGQIIVKAVNPTSQAQPTQFRLNSTNGIAPGATLIVLTSPNATDENSFAQPNYVSPVTNTLTGVTTNFNCTLAANSVNVFRFQIPGAGAAQIVSGPSPQTNELGSAASFGITATGTAPLVYQWSVDGNVVAGATNAAFTTTNMQLAADAVAVVASNLYGSATNTTTLTVRDTTPPTILWSFTNLSLNADASGHAIMPDITGTNCIRATDLSGVVVVTQNPTNGALLNLGTNLAVLTVTDSSTNRAYSTNQIVINSTVSPVITGFQLSGASLVISGTNGGAAGNPFYTLASTNLLLPLTNWISVATNQFGPGGIFIITNPWSPDVPQSFFILRLP